MAAGAASRFGRPKQLAEIDGESLVRRAIRTAIAADFSPVICVLGAYADEIAPTLHDLDVHVVVNPTWRLGLGTSVVRGVAAAINMGEEHLLAVILADQPFITAEHLRALESACRSDALEVAATGYEDAVGVPAVFSASMFPALQGLTRDRGAGAIIAACERKAIVAPDPRMIVDIDTPADLDSMPS